MPAYAALPSREDEDDEPSHARASLAYVIGASVLSGAGLMLVLLWLITGAWVDLVGILLMAIGFLLFFSPRAGADHAP
jgi:hypothetical protein